MKKHLIKILFLIFLYVGFCLYVYFNQKSFLFFPSSYILPIASGVNIREINIQTPDNIKLNGWWINNSGSKTVLFFHGNGGNVFYNEERLKIFKELKLNALMIDYRGYGKSSGNIENEKDLYIDGESAYNYLIEKGIKPENIIIWGQSLGGAITIDLASNNPAFAVIIESTFYSMGKMAAKQFWFLPTQILLKFHFDNYQKIGKIKSPVLLIHSTEDEMIGFENGQNLFELIQSHKQFLETKGTHNGGFDSSYYLYVNKLKEFLKLNN